MVAGGGATVTARVVPEEEAGVVDAEAPLRKIGGRRLRRELGKPGLPRGVAAEPGSAPPDGKCAFWVLRKSRWCSQPPGVRGGFCAVHDGGDERVPCPLDGSHTVRKRQLERHLRTCTAARKEQSMREQPWYKEAANAGGEGVFEEAERRPASRLIEAVLLICPPDEVNSSVERDAGRHEAQGELIVDVLEREGLLESATYLELGAGRGGLGEVLRKRLDSSGKEARIMVVERAGVKFKRDARARLERFRCDLRDVDLAKLPHLTSGVAVAKHLCGAATDMALKSVVLANTFEGVAIATCCHHACNWRDLVGRTDFIEELGLPIGEADFELLTRWSSWGLNDWGRHSSSSSSPAPPTSSAVSGLDPATKTRIGRRIKKLIDSSRAKYLKRHGFLASNSEYCDPRLSPENNLLLATKSRRHQEEEDQGPSSP